MTMTKHYEQLPRPTAELDRLAEYYDTHDTSTEMNNGDWVEPQPMATTSLRLPTDVIDQLKQQARTKHVRYTTYVRAILELAARGGSSPEWAEITERLDRIERALSGGLPHDDQKTALRTPVRPDATGLGRCREAAVWPELVAWPSGGAALGRLIPGHAPRFVRDEYDGSRLGPAPWLMT
ncbi:MAG: hypothetical protein ABSB76_10870 [Streptosporangiaceae bacterium]|jgi:hypothetical protein